MVKSQERNFCFSHRHPIPSAAASHSIATESPKNMAFSKMFCPLWIFSCCSFFNWVLFYSFIYSTTRVAMWCFFIFRCHIMFGNHTPMFIVIWNCSAEVIHQQRALVRLHSRWYFKLWALRSFVYTPRFLPVRSSHQRGAFSDTQTSTSTPTHEQPHTLTVHTHTIYIPLLSFIFLSYAQQSEIKRTSLQFKGHQRNVWMIWIWTFRTGRQ